MLSIFGPGCFCELPCRRPPRFDMIVDPHQSPDIFVTIARSRRLTPPKMSRISSDRTAGSWNCLCYSRDSTSLTLGTPLSMRAVAQTTDWTSPHAAEVRKLSTLLEVSQALLAARE